MIFSNPQNSNILEEFLRRSKSSNIEDEVHQIRLSQASEIIEYIHKSPSDWEECCKFNIAHIGEKFIRSLVEFDPTEFNTIDKIYTLSYRFLCEFDFLVGPGKELNIELIAIKQNIHDDITDMDQNLKSQIIYASYIMPANIVKDFINHKNIDAFRKFDEKKEEAKSLKEQWEGEIEDNKIMLDAFKEKLETYKTAFNFVGLYQGFTELLEKKKKEAFWLFLSLIGMGTLILAPLILEIILSTKDIFSNKPLGPHFLFILLPLISIEIIMIYFFRVILSNHRSIKAQIIQLELRQSLCQFIQNYTEYSSNIKKTDPSALEKFENLIFSGILTDSEKLPSTFGGMNEISNLIKTIKS